MVSILLVGLALIGSHVLVAKIYYQKGGYDALKRVSDYQKKVHDSGDKPE